MSGNAKALAGAAVNIIAQAGDRQRAGDRDNAKALYLGALGLSVDAGEAYQGLVGLALGSLSYEAAIALGRRAVSLRPDDGLAWTTLGNALWRAQRFSEAEPALMNGVKLRPDHCGPHHNLGLLYYGTGRGQLAASCFARALEFQPESVGLRGDLAQAILKTGNLTLGLDMLEVRWEGLLTKNPIWDAGLPQWRGEALAPGGTLLLHHEQGLGDTLQFVRFVSAIKALAGNPRIVFACPPPLHRLLAGQCGIDEVIDNNGTRDIVRAARVAAFHCPLLSAVAQLRPAYETLPAPAPYLKEPFAVDRPLKAGGARMGIGVCWGASQTPERGKQKSVPVGELVTIGELPGVRLWSLQFGPHADDLAATGADFLINSVPGGLGDFAETASIINTLDLVVTIDTATAHLAGALGKRCFMLNPINPCWRWVHGAAPWYRDMEVFDQVAPDNWRAPIAAVKARIGGMLGARSAA